MLAFLIIMSAAAIHCLDLGNIGSRGRFILGTTVFGIFIAVAQYLIFRDADGLVGIAAAVALVAGIRRSVRWLADEGGAVILAEWWRWTAAPWCVDTLLGCVAAVGSILSPARETHEAAPVTAPALVSETGETAPVRLPNGDRWGMLTPALRAAETASDTAHETAPVTFSDWLPTSIRPGVGFNAAAREALDRWGISRATYARRLAEYRQGLDQAAAA
ncbi:hypothetical protein JIG36_51080 [Actinoplanes sp. LDG1-06]|uniref:Uncharacterized protein n=1 Tax=Paractinoplanes ovalisporus TaxID=2810368 RepID=A0ABS2AVF3_9ACTN|nr:hypothetical protein [Actinoplanes ovalisporus]MBM2623863.1 hypothetical protein [Actinoplanes ovalisporus]